MKSTSVLAILALFVISSCDSPREKQDHDATPKALEEKKSYDLSYESRSPDLVESLYAELQEKDPELKTLVKDIQQLESSKADSVKSFHAYDEKNMSYYLHVKHYVDHISDSILKGKLENLVAESREKYTSDTHRQRTQLAAIDSQMTALRDRHNYLKVVRTMKMVEKYQKDNYPSSSPIEAYLKQLTGMVKRVDTLTKK